KLPAARRSPFSVTWRELTNWPTVRDETSLPEPLRRRIDCEFWLPWTGSPNRGATAIGTDVSTIGTGLPLGAAGGRTVTMKREEVVALDKARVWHPYTPMRQYVEETAPLVIERAEGARIFDVDGRSYVDGNASWWVALLGHRHPRLLRALREQSERM